MNVKLDKYKDVYIILNDFSTWPKSWTTFLEENRETMELYNRRYKEIEEQKLDKEKFYEQNIVNEYSNSMQDIEGKFSDIFYKEEKELLCFHATRLMDYEVENVKTEGLKIFSKDNISNKIDDLYKHNIINESERNLLQINYKTNHVKQIDVTKNRLYFVFGHQDIRCSTDNMSVLHPFLLNYGGEAIFKCFDRELDGSPKKELLNKLNSLSKPYIVISKTKILQLWERYGEQLFDLIIKHYIENQPNKIYNEFNTSQTNVSCLEIVEVDENSILE